MTEGPAQWLSPSLPAPKGLSVSGGTSCYRQQGRDIRSAHKVTGALPLRNTVKQSSGPTCTSRQNSGNIRSILLQSSLSVLTMAKSHNMMLVPESCQGMSKTGSVHDVRVPVELRHIYEGSLKGNGSLLNA